MASVDWTKVLESYIPNPCYERPFVCGGFPSDSIAIVIGENPATRMKENWWKYWKCESGFQLESFIADYRAKREKMGKRKDSNTRLRLTRFKENGVKCVETNAFSNEKADGAGEGTSNYAILNLLIANMPKLRAIIAHGDIAGAFLAKATIPKGALTYRTRHFRTESYATVDRICAEILSSRCG